MKKLKFQNSLTITSCRSSITNQNQNVLILVLVLELSENEFVTSGIAISLGKSIKCELDTNIMLLEKLGLPLMSGVTYDAQIKLLCMVGFDLFRAAREHSW